MAVFGSSRDPPLDRRRKPLRFSLDIETSKPCGDKFRLAFGISVPLVLVVLIGSLLGFN